MFRIPAGVFTLHGLLRNLELGQKQQPGSKFSFRESIWPQKNLCSEYLWVHLRHSDQGASHWSCVIYLASQFHFQTEQPEKCQRSFQQMAWRRPYSLDVDSERRGRGDRWN